MHALINWKTIRKIGYWARSKTMEAILCIMGTAINVKTYPAGSFSANRSVKNASSSVSVKSFLMSTPKNIVWIKRVEIMYTITPSEYHQQHTLCQTKSHSRHTALRKSSLIPVSCNRAIHRCLYAVRK